MVNFEKRTFSCTIGGNSFEPTLYNVLVYMILYDKDFEFVGEQVWKSEKSPFMNKKLWKIEFPELW